MVKIIQITITIFLLAGCSMHQNELSLKAKNNHISKMKNDIHGFKDQPAPPPPLIFPSIYKPITIFDNKKITISAANGAPVSKVIYTIAKSLGVNVVIDKDVPTDLPITLSLNNVSTKNALDTIMNISGCYYHMDGSILHIKRMMSKTFYIPYVHTQASADTKLGGDILGSAQTAAQSSGSSSGSSGGSSISGSVTLNYKNPKKVNDYYGQIENNVKNLLSKDGSYTLNRYSGILSVYDTKQHIQRITRFIKAISKSTGRQVLIEAKIMEVILNKDHQFGVDWNLLSHNLNGAGTFRLNQSLGFTNGAIGSISYSTPHFNSIISILESSGNVQTLANPRIKVLNGQTAMISSGKMVPFWQKQVDFTSVGTGASASTIPQVTYTQSDVLDGIALGVTPAIMPDGRVMLNIIPITSSIESITDFKDENGNSVGSAPVINMKEAGTTVYAHNNQLVIIGGLINSIEKDNKQGIPLLKDIPAIGELFKNNHKTIEKREMVILLKINVVQ